MINFQTISIDELCRDYNTRLGFVFYGATPSSDKSIEKLCNTLIQHNITTELPEMVIRVSENNYAVIYKDCFDGPTFFQTSSIAERMGICRVDSLYNVLKHHNTNNK